MAPFCQGFVPVDGMQDAKKCTVQAAADVGGFEDKLVDVFFSSVGCIILLYSYTLEHAPPTHSQNIFSSFTRALGLSLKW